MCIINTMAKYKIRRSLVKIINRFPSLANYMRTIRDKNDYKSIAEMTQWGFTIAGNKEMASGKYEPPETELFRCLVKDMDVMINIGANVGYYCCHALSLNIPVIAVEPIARNYNYLMRNIRDNGWANQAEIFPLAVGKCTDIVEIWGGGTAASLIKGWASIPENYRTTVPVITLDRILGASLDGKRALILVDIEGAEYMMLQGAKKCLVNSPRPTWIIEISTFEHQPDQKMNPNLLKTFKIMFDSGYEAFTADESLSKINMIQIEKVIKQESKFKTHNFLFK